MIQAYDLALNLYKNGEVDIEKSTLQEIREAVKKTNAYIPLVIAQTLIYIDKIEWKK